MWAVIFTKRFFSALFLSGAWYWRILWALVVALLLGFPPWSEKYPLVARMLSDLGIPYWAYGLAASIAVACYFAWQIATLTAPRVIPTRLNIGHSNFETDAGPHYRIEVRNISFAECDRLMCVIKNICINWGVSNQECYDKSWIDFTCDLPFVLTTQNRIRYSRENNSQLKRGRWRLDPGEDKNVELFQYSSGAFSILHESGIDHIGTDHPVFTFDVQLSGGVSPVSFWIVVFSKDRRITPFLAKDVADLLALQQFCAADFVGDG